MHKHLPQVSANVSRENFSDLIILKYRFDKQLEKSKIKKIYMKILLSFSEKILVI